MKYYLVRLDCLMSQKTNFIREFYPSLRNLMIDNDGNIWRSKNEGVISIHGNCMTKTKETIYDYYDKECIPYYIPVEFSEETEYDDVFVKELISDLDICISEIQLSISKQVTEEEIYNYINGLDIKKKENLSEKLNIYYDLQKQERGRAKIIKFPMERIKKD